MAGNPVAKAGIEADPRKLDGSLRKSRTRFQKFGDKLKSDIGRSIKGAFSGLSTLGGFATVGGLAIAGKSALEFEDGLNRIAIQGDFSSAKVENLRGKMNALSADTGIARGEILAGADALVNLQGAQGLTIDKLKVMADAQLATGAAMEDLAGLSFALNKSFKLENAAQMEAGLSAIITAGKEGAIPLNQMSVLLQQLSADFAKVGGTGVAGAADLSAALQVTRTGFGTAEQAATGLGGLLTALGKNAGRLRKSGVKVFEKDPKTGIKSFRSLRDILDQINESKLIKDPSKLIKALGRAEAQKAFDAINNNRQEFDRLSAAAKGSTAVQDDAAKRRESSAFKIKKAFNDVKLAIAEVFTEDRIKVFTKAVKKFADLLKWMVDNPLKSMGLLFATKFGPGALGALLGGGGGGRLGGSAAKAAAGAGAAKAAAGAGAGAAKAAAGGIAKASGAGLALAGAAGAAGFALGTLLDNSLGLSDVFAGIENTTAKVEGLGQDDPTGRAAKLRAKGELLFKQGFEDRARGFFTKADDILIANNIKNTKRKEGLFDFKKLFQTEAAGSVAARLRGGGDDVESLTEEQKQQAFNQLKRGPRAAARAFAKGADFSFDKSGAITVVLRVDDDGNLKTENSKSQRKGSR